MDFYKKYKVSNREDKEFYRVYDESGNLIGEINVEDEKKLTNQYLKGVTCFVINHENMVLVEQRANSTQLTPGKLDLVSGHINGMEIGRHAMIRELGEEVGIIEETENLRKIQAIPLTFDSKGKKRNFIIEFYYLLTKYPKLEMQKDEVQTLMWMPLETVFEKIKNGKTKFPAQGPNVNYDEIFNVVREACLNRNDSHKNITSKITEKDKT